MYMIVNLILFISILNIEFSFRFNKFIKNIPIVVKTRKVNFCETIKY